MRPIKLLIIQNTVPHYRIPLFHSIGSLPNIELKVLHSGPPTAIACKNLRYTEQVAPIYRRGPLIFQSQVWSAFRHADVAIVMFDLHWLHNNLLPFFPPSRRCPLIYWGHGYGRNPLLKPLRTALAHRADALLLYGEGNADEFARQGISRKKIFVAPNTIAVPTPANVLNRSRYTFLFIGRMQPRKRVKDLLKAYALALPDLPPDIQLEIIGDGPELPGLRSLAESLKISGRVSFYGEITDHHVLASHFSRALAYISPGAIGLAALHSFAHGVPVVTTLFAHHGPEVRNIYEDENGLFYDGTAESLAGILRRLAIKRDFASELGENAYKYYWSQRTMSDMVAGFAQAIEYVTQHRT